MLCLWKQFPDEMVHQKTLAKNHQLFLVPGSRSKHFGQLLQNPKLQLMASLSSNHSLDLYLPKYLGLFTKLVLTFTTNKKVVESKVVKRISSHQLF